MPAPKKAPVRRQPKVDAGRGTDGNGNVRPGDSRFLPKKESK